MLKAKISKINNINKYKFNNFDKYEMQIKLVFLNF